MKIVVSIKQVPDTAAKVTVENGQASWGDAPLVMNPWDEYAVEAALTAKENHGGEVIAISLGDASAREALKTALAMGCSEAILVCDPALERIDSQAAAQVLAAAIRKLGDVDLAFFGKQAVDGDMGVTHAMTARILGWPALTGVSVIRELAGDKILVERTLEEGRQVVEAQLPAVVSVLKDIGEPRYPSFMGIRKASRAQIPEWTLADLGISVPQSAVQWPELSSPPERQVSTEMVTGSSPQETAQKLADKILAEKIL